MGFLRAILADFVGPEPIMRFPPLEAAFRETDEQAREAEDVASRRIFSAMERGVLVNVENDSDVESVQEPDEASDFGSEASDATSLTTAGSHIHYPLESVATPVSTEVSMEVHTDIADLADLEGFDADVA
jgi:hypothetical protein